MTSRHHSRIQATPAHARRQSCAPAHPPRAYHTHSEPARWLAGRTALSTSEQHIQKQCNLRDHNTRCGNDQQAQHRAQHARNTNAVPAAAYHAAETAACRSNTLRTAQPASTQPAVVPLLASYVPARLGMCTAYPTPRHQHPRSTPTAHSRSHSNARLAGRGLQGRLAGITRPVL
jgi:hypothetical protein